MLTSDDFSTYVSYLDGISHLSGLLDVAPTVVAHDLHPDYPSTRYAHELQDVIGDRLRGADVLIHLEPEDRVRPGEVL